MQKFIRSSVVLLAVLLSADATAQAATNIVCTGCVNTGDLAANSVSSAKIASGAVTSAKIQDATVALADLSADVRARLNRGMPVYAGGTMTGHLLGIEGRSGNGAAVEQVASLISSKGYLFEIRLDEGTLWDMGGVYFSGSGCTGEAYYSFDAAGAGGRAWVRSQGIVLPGPSGALYTPRGSAVEERSYLSRFNSGVCTEQSSTIPLGGVALPNNPTVTGVSGSTFAFPVVFGVP